MKTYKELFEQNKLVEKFKLDLKKMTDKKYLQKVADDIFSADEGYGNYKPAEINKELYRLGLTDKDGTFLVDIKDKKKEKIANQLSNLIG